MLLAWVERKEALSVFQMSNVNDWFSREESGTKVRYSLGMMIVFQISKTTITFKVKKKKLMLSNVIWQNYLFMFNEGRISFIFIFIITTKKINASLNFIVLELCPVMWDIFTMAIKLRLYYCKERRNWETVGCLALINKDKRSANDI